MTVPLESVIVVGLVTPDGMVATPAEPEMIVCPAAFVVVTCDPGPDGGLYVTVPLGSVIVVRVVRPVGMVATPAEPEMMVWPTELVLVFPLPVPPPAEAGPQVTTGIPAPDDSISTIEQVDWAKDWPNNRKRPRPRPRPRASTRIVADLRVAPRLESMRWFRCKMY